MKHGKYSKTKEVRPYEVVVTVKRYDGITKDYFYTKTEESAKDLINFFKASDIQPNQYYFGTTYEINYIGSEKYIKA